MWPRCPTRPGPAGSTPGARAWSEDAAGRDRPRRGGDAAPRRGIGGLGPRPARDRGALRHPRRRRSWPAARGDNAAAGIGVGVVAAGQAFVSLGTSGVLFAANDGYRPDPATAVHTFCHALPGTWHQMGVILAATDALNWFAGIAGAEAGASDRGAWPPARAGQDPLPALSRGRADAPERRHDPRRLHRARACDRPAGGDARRP